MNWADMFFQNWQGIVRTIIVGTLAYILLVFFLRVSGKRTLAKLNAFDLVVTVALGSTLASTLLQESVALAEGATAFLLLVMLQFVVTFLSVRSNWFARTVRSEPKLLARDGQLCHAAMKQERITEDEALSAARASGARDISDVSYMILESDGTISVGMN
ncbi:DUF421 domain-containing protein [Falsirhodobacter deserti]|uniref:DUF421 domain-containing protein n=1 Tax=Falsirhodobacter deserti TaxID=1365611 RepID=UPI000FE42378|nr:YetF domain-containing protein [Falsirhodobacter deserti]